MAHFGGSREGPVVFRPGSMTSRSDLARIIEVAQQIDTTSPSGLATFRSLALAVAEAIIAERPRPIQTAPHVPSHVLLLYCPTQAGWQAGRWFDGRWVSTADDELVLEPTYWTDVPLPPKEA